MGPEVAAEALSPPPTHRLGLEACWEVVRRLLDRDQAGLATGRLLTRLFHETMKLAEGDPAARFLAGHIARARGDLEGASKYFDQVAEATQDRVLAARARLAGAFLHFEAGRIEEAMTSLVRLARQASGAERGQALERLRECYLRLALPDFAAALERGSEGTAADQAMDMVEAWLESRAGRFKEAAALFARVHEAAPLAGEVARSYAAALRASSRDADAVDLLRSVCARSPEDAESFYQLARLHHEGGDLEACHAPLEGALRVDPGHSRSLHLKGLLHEKEGRFEEAAQCFERAIKQTRGLSSAYTGLARSYIATARYLDAAEVYRRTLELGPECRLPAYRELGILYEGHLHDPEKALFWFQRYLTQGGEDGEVLERYKRLAAKVNTYPKSVGRGLS
jgi:tetratricopeptide (TPR) repeat protein